MRILSGIQAGQVLQRRGRSAIASVEGECARSGEVLVAITRGGKPLPGWRSRVCGRAADGRFTAQLKGIPQGGPYALTLAVGRERLTVKEVFVGDVWMLAGQSNMQGIGNLDRAPKPHPLVRSFGMDRRWTLAREPMHVLLSSPDPVHNPTAAKPTARPTKGVGPGLAFAIEMVRRTGVPQGLICTAHGGSSMTHWNPELKDQGGRSLYGSLLLSTRATAQPIAGILWYQGESDTSEAAAAVYRERMERLVSSLRADLGDVPFLTAQIGRVVREGGSARWWNAIQELQRLLPRTITDLDVVAAVDLPLDDLIHIAGDGQGRLGARFARSAARLVHGTKRERPAPSPRSIRRLPPKAYPICPMAIEVRFADVLGGLRSDGVPSGFTLVDGEHRAVPAIYKTVLDGDRVILETSLPQERPDLRVMYGHGENPLCNLVDGRDMPIPVFGPLLVENVHPSTGYLTTWRISAVKPSEDIDTMDRPLLEPDWERRSWTGNMVDQHALWLRASGHAAFVVDLALAGPMRLELKIGYDGPIRAWIGDQELLRDLAGTNPAIADSVTKPVSLPSGTHRLTILMALNDGKAYGFFLRFGRTDLKPTVSSTAEDLPRVVVP